MLLHVLPNRLVTSNGVVFNRKSIEFHGSSLKSMHGSLGLVAPLPSGKMSRSRLGTPILKDRMSSDRGD